MTPKQKYDERKRLRLENDLRAIAALKDLVRNDGFMWEPKTGDEAALLWKDLRRRGWVRGYFLTDAGLSALTEGRKNE